MYGSVSFDDSVFPIGIAGHSSQSALIPLETPKNANKLISRYLYQICHGCGLKACTKNTCKTYFSSLNVNVFSGNEVTPFASLNLAARLAGLLGINGLCYRLQPMRLPPRISSAIDENNPLRTVVLIQSLNTITKKQPAGPGSNTQFPATSKELSKAHVVSQSAQKLNKSDLEQMRNPEPSFPIIAHTFTATPDIEFPWVHDKKDIHEYCLDSCTLTTPIDYSGLIGSKLKQTDPTGIKCATSALLVLSNSAIWVEAADTDFILGGRTTVAFKMFPCLEHFVHHAVSQLTDNQLFFVRMVSNVILSLPPMQTLLKAGKALDLTKISDSSNCLVKCLIFMFDNISVENRRFVATPPQFAFWAHHSKFKTGDRVEITIPQCSEYDLEAAQKILRSLSPNSGMTRSRYFATLSRYIEDGGMKMNIIGKTDFKVQENSDKQLLNLKIWPKNIPVYTTFPLAINTLDWKPSGIYYLRDLQQMVPSFEKFKFFRYHCYQHMLYASKCVLSIRKIQGRFRSSPFSGDMKMHYNSMTVLQIDRESIFDTAMDAMTAALLDGIPYPFHIPLKVCFGANILEVGFDQGGVQTEFFKCLGEALMKDSLAFQVDSDSQLAWFGNYPHEDRYFYLGILFGIAVFNGNTIAVDFPLLFYSLILKCTSMSAHEYMGKNEIKLEDFQEVFPVFVNTMLSYKDNKKALKEAFIPYEFSFINVSDNWKKNIAFESPTGFVTELNYDKYISRYISLRTTGQVSNWLDRFCEGLFVVLDRELVAKFTASELRLLFQGSRRIDAQIIKFNATYEGYSSNSTTIQYFWDIVLNDLSEQDLSNLLLFVTGTNRIPPTQKFDFVLVKNGVPSLDNLPTASVCFSQLMLPEYKSKEQMKNRLLLALENSTGFGVV